MHKTDEDRGMIKSRWVIRLMRPWFKEVGLSGFPPDITNTFILRNDFSILTREMAGYEFSNTNYNHGAGVYVGLHLLRR